MLNEVSVPFIQSPCHPSLVPILSPPQHVVIVCVAELVDIYSRDVMVPIKTSNNFFAPYVRKLQFTHILSHILGEGTSLSMFYAHLKIH